MIKQFKNMNLYAYMVLFINIYKNNYMSNLFINLFKFFLKLDVLDITYSEGKSINIFIHIRTNTIILNNIKVRKNIGYLYLLCSLTFIVVFD